MLNKILSLVLSVFLFIPTIAAASESATSQSNWGVSIYQKLNDYDFLLTPMSGAVIGSAVGGAWGGAIGALIGGADECLIYRKVSSYTHLTAGFLGLALAKALRLPYFVAESLGFGIGLSISTGYLNLASTQLSGLASGLISGVCLAQVYQKDRLLGAGVGAGFAGFDYFLSGSASIAFLTDFTRVVVLRPLIVSALSKTPRLGPILAENLQTEITLLIVFVCSPDQQSKQVAFHGDTIKTPEELRSELGLIFKRLANRDILEELLRKQVTCKVAMAMLSAFFVEEWSKRMQDIRTMSAFLSPGNAVAEGKYQHAVKLMGLLLIPITAESFAKEFLSQYQKSFLSQAIESASHSKLLGLETPLFLRSEKVLDADVQNFKRNAFVLTDSAIGVLWATTDSYTSALYSGFILYNNKALDMVIIMNSYSSFFTVLLNAVESHLTDVNVQIDMATAKVEQLASDLRSRPRAIVLSPKQDLLLSKVEEKQQELANLNADRNLWNSLQGSIQVLKRWGDVIFACALVGPKLASGQMPSNSNLAVRNAIDNLLGTNWLLKNHNQLQVITKAEKSIDRVLDYLDKPCDQSSALRIAKSVGEENSIRISRMTIGILEPRRELLTVDQVELPAGRYVLTGDSGSGKSSFLSKIRGIRCNGIYAAGEIAFVTQEGSSSEVFEISQEDYIPPYSSLLEIITGKTKKHLEGHETVRQRARELLTLLKIDSQGEIANQIDEEKNWGDTLSGGQKRKVALATMLMRKPAFVILDETFAQLDDESIRVSQDLLRRELPDSVIIVIDHKASDNNFEGFYQKNLHIENRALKIRQIKS